MHNATKYGVLLAVLAMFAIPGTGMTQPATGKVSVDLRGGVAIPAGNLDTYTSIGGGAGASAMWNWNPNWGFRVDFDWMELNKGEDDFGVLLSPPQRLMFLGGSVEVNFNPPKYQTMGFTFMLNAGAGAMKMTVDDTYDAGSPANTFDSTYPAFQGGMKIGYQVAPWINIFVNGTAYFILMDAADTSPAFGDDFNNGWVIPVTAGARLTFMEF